MTRADEDKDTAGEANLESQEAVAHERRLSTIETERHDFATKNDLSQLETRLIKWLVATQLAVTGFLFSTQLALAALLVHMTQ